MIKITYIEIVVKVDYVLKPWSLHILMNLVRKPIHYIHLFNLLLYFTMTLLQHCTNISFFLNTSCSAAIFIYLFICVKCQSFSFL